MTLRAERRRVVITGRGVVTPIGIGVEVFWSALLEGVCGIAPLPGFAGSVCPTRIGAEVSSPPLRGLETRTRTKLMGRHIQFAVAAGIEAMAEAGLGPGQVPAHRLGVVIGTSQDRGDFVRNHACLTRMRHPGDPRRVDERLFWSAALALFDPLEFLRTLPNGSAAHLAMAYDAQGPNGTVLAEGVAGLQAIGDAARLVERGDADAVLAGGTDCLITVERLVSLGMLGHLSRRNGDPCGASRPFDRGRDGFVPGEGAAIVLLEAAEHAEARAARVLGEIVGYATALDATDRFAGAASGWRWADTIGAALADGQRAPRDLGYVCASGLSHPTEDAAETAALKRALGEAAAQTPVSSIKAQVGFLGNAAGPLDVVTSLLAMEHGVLPPTRNYSIPDPRCDLDYVPNTPRAARPIASLVSARGFVGHTACLVLERCAP
jgi:3-oxoacyl-[acyl-carrier-protein] synthase II